MSLQALVRRAFDFSKSELRGLAVLFIVSLLARFAIISFIDWRQRALDRQLEGYLMASKELLLSLEQLTTDSAKLTHSDSSRTDTTKIKIDEQLNAIIATTRSPERKEDKGRGSVKPAFSLVKVVDVNTADQAAFESLPGIGPVLAARAVRFRDALGGFSSVAQFSELYGLKDSVYQALVPYLSCETLPVQHKLNLNSCTLDELKSHPYIAPWVAEAIVEFRKSKGQIYVLSEIKVLPQVTDSLFDKLVPYLVVN